MLNSLSPGLPGALTALDLLAADFTGMPADGYEGYEYDDDILMLIWTDRGQSAYESLKTHFSSKLGAKTTYTNGQEISSDSLAIKQYFYKTSGATKECYIQYYKKSTDVGGIILPAGTIMVVFGEE
jgi:hypothetical protein